MSSPGRLAPQARPQALAELEVAIAKAEADRERHRLTVKHARDHDDSRRAKVFLRIAEERLAQLQSSLTVLIDGENQSAAEAEAS
jgi:hypothetical protein